MPDNSDLTKVCAANNVYFEHGWGETRPRAALASAGVVGYTNNPVPIKTGTTASATITTGGAAQPGKAANANRNYLFVQNNSTGDLWFNFSGTAAIGTGIRLVAGAFYEAPAHFVSPNAISIVGATTGQAFTIVEA